MDAAAIEQMNKVRVSLGMAPLPVPGKDTSGPVFKSKVEDDEESEEDELSTLDKRQAAAGSNWQRLEAERQEKLDRRKRKDAAKKARDAVQRFTKLEGKGLGDEIGDQELDTRSWLLGQKKRQRQIEKARKMEEELAAREQAAEYTSKDLAGVKVGHEIGEFEDAADGQILTLRDAEIGENSEEDELENAELRAKEKVEERLKLKKKRPDYDPTDQAEAKNVLSKYDEEIDGKKRKRFTLDGEGQTGDIETQKRSNGDENVKTKGIKIDLDIFRDEAPISDYVDPSTIKVKKPKKSKKEKKTRQKTADEDDIFPPVEPAQAAAPEADSMDVDGNKPNSAPGKSKTLAFELDDDDLQAKLAEQRRQALKKRKKMDAAELARQMREEMPIDEEELEEGGLVMDETSEFVANLKKPEAPEEREKGKKSETPLRATAASPDVKEEDEDEDGDTHMANESYASIEEAESKDRIKRETSAPVDVTATGLEDEDTMAGSGLGASLSLLRKRGLISDASSANLSDKERQRARFLADKQHLIDEYDVRARHQRDLDRRSGKWDRMSNRDRDTYARQQNEHREAYIARLLADMFNKEYRPDVKLQYHDEYGRSMNQKEAFKHLSHMFHGKGSGKQKTEKRLKKIEDEKKEMAKGSLNVGETEGGMMNVQGREGKRQRMAGVRLQ